MTDRTTFLCHLIAARRSAWRVLIVAMLFQALTYLAYLGMVQGWFDGLIQSGIYGDMSRADLLRVTFLFVAALKLMNIAICLGALFLTLWVRALGNSPMLSSAK